MHVSCVSVSMCVCVCVLVHGCAHALAWGGGE